MKTDTKIFFYCTLSFLFFIISGCQPTSNSQSQGEKPSCSAWVDAGEDAKPRFFCYKKRKITDKDLVQVDFFTEDGQDQFLDSYLPLEKRNPSFWKAYDVDALPGQALCKLFTDNDSLWGFTADSNNEVYTMAGQDTLFEYYSIRYNPQAEFYNQVKIDGRIRAHFDLHPEGGYLFRIVHDKFYIKDHKFTLISEDRPLSEIVDPRIIFFDVGKSRFQTQYIGCYWTLENGDDFFLN